MYDIGSTDTVALVDLGIVTLFDVTEGGMATNVLKYSSKWKCRVTATSESRKYDYFGDLQFVCFFNSAEKKDCA